MNQEFLKRLNLSVVVRLCDTYIVLANLGVASLPATERRKSIVAIISTLTTENCGLFTMAFEYI
jgi:hypothetical protein